MVDQSIDQQLIVSLPQLRGQPAYARPMRAPVEAAPRPFDPDDLPLDIEMTEDEREFAMSLPERPYTFGATEEPAPANGHDSHHLLPRPFRLRSLIGRSSDSGE